MCRIMSGLSTQLAAGHIIVDIICQMKPVKTPFRRVVHASCSRMAGNCRVVFLIDQFCTKEQRNDVISCSFLACWSQKNVEFVEINRFIRDIDVYG